MSATERIDILRTWQEAALVERDALVAARDEIAALTDERGAGEYPRLKVLDAVIEEIDQSVTQRDARITKIASVDSAPVEPTRLALLLRRQGDGREERQALVEARNDILREAEDMGLVDLNDEQDRRFRALTREIASVDDELAVRDEEIDRLAALRGIHSVDS